MPISTANRRLARKRAGGRCEYCRCPESHSTQNFSVDHIWPQSLEGDDELTNLALACQGCNNRKYNKTGAHDPVTGVEAPLFDPRRQRWVEHFRWSDDKLRVLGLTPTGRATVAALDLNREGVLNLRDVLLLRGFHPPDDD